MLALPDDETLLVQHWTLSRDDLAVIVRRRRPHNRLGFVQHLSPLGWQHTNLTGDCLWTDPDVPSTALRPLRQIRVVEGSAKP